MEFLTPVFDNDQDDDNWTYASPDLQIQVGDLSTNSSESAVDKQDRTVEDSVKQTERWFKCCEKRSRQRWGMTASPRRLRRLNPT